MNFVLRNGNGALAGYLMQGQGELRLRAQGIPEGGAVMVLMEKDGREREQRLLATGEEQRWPDPGKRLLGAYAMQGERLLFCTGPEAKAACLRRIASAQQQKKPAQQTAQAKSAQAKGAQETAQEKEPPAGREAFGQIAWPERRWPLPPCWPEARYEGGRWRTPIRDAEDRPGEAPRCDDA